MDAWFVEHLVCPRDHTVLQQCADRLVCASGHSYPIVDGVPVMLVEEASPTHHVCGESLAMAAGEQAIRYDGGDLDSDEIDSHVQDIIVGTCGNLCLCSWPIVHTSAQDAGPARRMLL